MLTKKGREGKGENKKQNTMLHSHRINNPNTPECTILKTQNTVTEVASMFN